VLAVSTREISGQVERREAPRFPLGLAVKLEHGEGRARDVSASGIFFTTQGTFCPGALVTFIIELEHADPSRVLPIACEGTVVRIEPLPNAIGVAVRISSFDFTGRHISRAMSVTRMDDCASSTNRPVGGSQRGRQ
jgi:hypothetical protein